MKNVLKYFKQARAKLKPQNVVHYVDTTELLSKPPHKSPNITIALNGLTISQTTELLHKLEQIGRSVCEQVNGYPDTIRLRKLGSYERCNVPHVVNALLLCFDRPETDLEFEARVEHEARRLEYEESHNKSEAESKARQIAKLEAELVKLKRKK